MVIGSRFLEAFLKKEAAGLIFSSTLILFIVLRKRFNL